MYKLRPYEFIKVCDVRKNTVFENRILKRIIGPEMDEVKGNWRTLHNDLHNLNSPNIITVIN